MGLSVSAELFQGVMGNEWIESAVFHGITAADSGRRLMADASLYLWGSSSLCCTSPRQPSLVSSLFAITEESGTQIALVPFFGTKTRRRLDELKPHEK